MPTLETVKLDALFAMFKGEPGTRKSTSALSFPEPQYWFSIDKKMDALVLPAKHFGTDLSKVHYDDYSKYDDLRAKLEKFQITCPYKTLVLDSITSEGDIINFQTLKMKAGSRNRAGEEKGFSIGGIAVNTIDDYKAEASAFLETISLLKDIYLFHKVNVVLIAHVIGARKPDEKAPHTHFSRVIVTGGQTISAKIPAYCSEVYHFNIEPDVNIDKEGQYGLLTVHTGHDFARTSLPLQRRITFNNQPLYPKFIKPAIDELNKLTPLSKL